LSAIEFSSGLLGVSRYLSISRNQSQKWLALLERVLIAKAALMPKIAENHQAIVAVLGECSFIPRIDFPQD
jgi:hypothetical protein